MSRTIWKFPLRIEDTQSVGIPEGGRILTVQMQGYCPCLWALVDPYAPVTRRSIRIFGTGHEINDAESLTYIGTFQMGDAPLGSLVFHVFEVAA